MLNCFANPGKKNIPIILITPAEYPQWLTKQKSFVQHWLKSSGYEPENSYARLIPDEKGNTQLVLCCVKEKTNVWSMGNLPYLLPEDIYYLAEDNIDLIVGWGLGAYQFTRYKKPQRNPAKLAISSAQQKKILPIIEAIYWTRDLINTPTDDLGPTEFANEINKFSKQYKIKFKQIIGDALLKQNFPSIHLVGRASDDEPRLIDLRWGNTKHPKITLVGKGVCFDSGGLDIKSASAMLLMKKDMGGAAHVLGLARLIVEAKLKVCLRVLIPIVENVISGNAFRPGDIFRSRKGMTVEIGNTDAEGRVILADTLTEAVSENPDLLIDITTLTGAARIALGADLPAMFCNQDKLAADIIAHAEKEQDYVWRLPLFSSYRDSLNSAIADISSTSSDSYGGAITAALFLKEFVPDNIPWLHFDLMAWNQKSRPGRPVGGEAMAIRGIFSYLVKKFT